MSLKQVIFIADPHFYSHYTVTHAIEELGVILGVPVRKYALRDLFEPDDGENLVILEGYQFRGESAATGACGNSIDGVRQVFPNSKIIVMGSYSTHCKEYIEYDHPGKADLHLDTSYNVARSMRERGMTADMYLWSGSRAVYDAATEYDKKHRNNDRQRDVLCLSRCPNSSPGQYFYERFRLLSGLQERGILLGVNLEAWTIDQVFHEYEDSFIALGTTTPSSDLERNGKEFRDWIAPHLGCLLIHDDYEGYVDIYKDIVPIYTYGDIDGCTALIRDVLDNREKYECLISKQIDFAYHNTIELQLLRAYNKYIIKTEPNISLLQKP